MRTKFTVTLTALMAMLAFVAGPAYADTDSVDDDAVEVEVEVEVEEVEVEDEGAMVSARSVPPLLEPAPQRKILKTAKPTLNSKKATTVPPRHFKP